MMCSSRCDDGGNFFCAIIMKIHVIRRLTGIKMCAYNNSAFRIPHSAFRIPHSAFRSSLVYPFILSLSTVSTVGYAQEAGRSAA